MEAKKILKNDNHQRKVSILFSLSFGVNGPYGPFTPAIFSTITWTCTISIILGCTVLNETIHTCDFSNYCVNLKVKEWVVYPFLRDFLRDFCALYWVGNKFSCFVDIFCTLLFM